MPQSHAMEARASKASQTSDPTSTGMAVRAAESEELPAILDLLSECRLPTAGVSEHLQTFVVAVSDGSVHGVGGLEVYGRVALLRSLAVSPAHRLRRLATAICDGLEEEATKQGVEQLYLLTETAAPYFSARGYALLPRSAAPVEIASSQEFASLCPESATLMVRALRTPE